MILNTLKYIYQHPFNAADRWGALARFFKWQLQCQFNPSPVIHPLTEHSRMIMWKGLTGATGNLYCGLLEFSDMGFLLHFLRPEDHFTDIGANVGVYTLLASGEIGAFTTCAEPVPVTFNHLMDNLRLNDIQQNVQALNIGLGNSDGLIRFTRSLDTVNHVAVAGETDTLEVPVKRLDQILETTPVLIKIDVEGFETDVLNGANRILEDPALKAIIIELNGSGERYGYDEKDIHQKLLQLGFEPHTYDPLKRQLILLNSYGPYNTIYIRDKIFVQNRIESARKVKVANRRF